MNSKLRKSLQYIAILGMFLPGILYSQDAKSFPACACQIKRDNGSRYTQFDFIDPCIPAACDGYCTEFIKDHPGSKVTSAYCTFVPGKKGKTQSKTK
jgi:hypothetical protein